VVAMRIAGRGGRDYWGDRDLHCLTIFVGSLLYGLIALPMVRSWTRKQVARP
jgi:hypothetical protein